MALIPRYKRLAGKGDESGIALFMVIAAMTILSVVVTEFTYVAQVNTRATVDSSDQLKAHYLAKSGLKLSLLRLRAFKELKAFGKEGSGLPSIPKGMLDQIWSFPFFYPIPGDVPGLTVVMKDEIEKFQKDSTLPGKFTAIIESESDKVGINSILPALAPPVPIPSPSATPGAPAAPGGKPGAAPKAIKFDVEEARKGIKDLLFRLVEEKFKKDQDFAAEYRDVDVEEIYDNIVGWVDFAYQPKNSSGKQAFYKKAPFYSMSELRMLHPIDDGLFDLIASNFTTFITPGLNANKIREPMLRALLTGITDEEVIQFFKDRDSTETDGTFKAPDDFFKYIETNVAVFRSSTNLDDLKTKLTKQGIQILTDEEIFKITVTAEVNKATRILEAWVMIESAAAGAKKPARPATNVDASGNPPSTDLPTAQPNAAGLRLLFMRES